MVNKKVILLNSLLVIPSSVQLLGSWLKHMITKVKLGKRKGLPLPISGNILDLKEETY
jgi:hypothetical protein